MMKGQSGLIILLAVAALGASFAAGYFYLKSQSAAPVRVQTSSIIETSEAPKTIESTLTVTPSKQAEITAMPTKTMEHTAVVVFEPPLGQEFADKNDIQKKIIDPFLDYYADENGEGYLVSLAISQNAQASKTTYPYLATAIFKNGGNSGFVIGKTDGNIQYWVPECMKCTFSASFNAKYPEIVKHFK